MGRTSANTAPVVTWKPGSHIDPSLIGGMVAQVGGKVFDASVKTRLSELRQQLLDSNPTTPVGDA